MLYLQNNDCDIDFSNKIHLVDEFAKRWWYALAEWPPVGINYNLTLKEKGLQAVEYSKVKDESKGLKKVYQVEAYEGLYKDKDGHLYDLRPQDTMPCLMNFQKMAV